MSNRRTNFIGNNGYTMVELIIVSTSTALIIASVGIAFVGIIRNWNKVQSNNKSSQEIWALYSRIDNNIGSSKEIVKTNQRKWKLINKNDTLHIEHRENSVWFNKKRTPLDGLVKSISFEKSDIAGKYIIWNTRIRYELGKKMTEFEWRALCRNDEISDKIPEGNKIGDGLDGLFWDTMD